MAHLRFPLVSVATLFLQFLFPHGSAAQTPTILYSFSGGADGANPLGVIEGGAGVLYGTTCNGGTSDSGAVYRLTAPEGGSGPWTKLTLYSFMGTSDGACPNTLVLGAGGVLYGTTAVDNQTASLTAFSLTPPQSAGNPWTFTLLYTFTEEEGAALGLADGPDGVLYITTRFGGTGGVGSVESLTPPATLPGPWTLTVLHNFVFTEYGAYPFSGVIVGPGGELYGTTQNGGITGCPVCGVVYALFPPATPGGNWPFKILFSMTPKASFPVGVAMGKGGVLYGVADEGGRACPDCASVFSLTPPATPGGAWTEAIPYAFPANDFNNSYNPLVIGPGGVLYGTANLPGATQTCCGVIFSVTPPASGSGGGWTETTLHDFTGAPSDGSQPNSALIFGKGGMLFGTTGSGGTSNLGTVYGLRP